MQDDNEYLTVLDYFYNKSLMLQDTSGFNKVLYFYLVDALAHIDYTLGVLAYNYGSPKNIMGAEYMRWRIDEEKKGDRAKVPGLCQLAPGEQAGEVRGVALTLADDLRYGRHGQLPEFPDRARPGQQEAASTGLLHCRHR